MMIEQAIHRHGMPMMFSDPASSDQRAHVGRASAHEHDMNKRVMKELKRSIQVRDVALIVKLHQIAQT